MNTNWIDINNSNDVKTDYLPVGEWHFVTIVIRSSGITLYVDGRGHEIRTVGELMTSVNQLLVSMQNTRQQLDRSLLRLTTLELENYVTFEDVADSLYLFEVLMTEAEGLDRVILQLGHEGRTIQMQRDEFIGDMDDKYTLMIRDYAADSSEANAEAIRRALHDTNNTKLRSPKRIAELLGYEGKTEDSTITPLGLRTLSNVSVVRRGMADKIVGEYGSLSELMDDIEQNPDRLDDLGVDNPAILADSLYRMWGKRA